MTTDGRRRGQKGDCGDGGGAIIRTTNAPTPRLRGMREANGKRERNGGDRDFSPPVARTRVSALDRHADAAANRGRPLAALNGGGRTATSDWPAILFYPTSHGSRAAPAEPPSRGFAPDATCSTKFLREPPRFCQCTKRTRVRQIKLSLEKKNITSEVPNCPGRGVAEI